MIIPDKYSPKDLTFPLNTIYWSCKVTRSDLIGAFLIPLPLVVIGMLLHFFYHQAISVGMWFALLWTALTFYMMYSGQQKVQTIFDSLQGIIPDTAAAKEKEQEVRANIYRNYNNRYYYWVGFLVTLIVLPIMYQAIISKHTALPLQVWSSLYFLYTAFVGGVGMTWAVIFNRVVMDILQMMPFKLNPHHPDYFMGLKPLGNLAVVNVVVASSSSLLFPLIFEVTRILNGNNSLSEPLGYLIFAIIMCALIAAFVGPLMIIKTAIERQKYAVLIEHEKEYQERLANYKADPSESGKNILQMMQLERTKLHEIRLFPFETKMLFQIFASGLLPIIMLLIQKYFKA